MTLIVECLINVSVQVDGAIISVDGRVFPPYGEWGFHDTVDEGVLKDVPGSVGRHCIRAHVDTYGLIAIALLDIRASVARMGSLVRIVPIAVILPPRLFLVWLIFLHRLECLVLLAQPVDLISVALGKGANLDPQRNNGGVIINGGGSWLTQS